MAAFIDLAKGSIPIASVFAISAGAVSLALWINNSNNGVVRSVEKLDTEFRTRLERIEEKLDGRVSTDRLELWIERARRQYPDLPDF